MKAHKNQKDTIDIVAVAKAAKVSISTVSRSYNHPNLVKPATRRRIEKAIERLGYIRNRAAQTMHGKRSGTIGLIVPTVNHTIFSEVIQSFSEVVEEEGFTMLITSHRFDLKREYSVLRKLLEHRVDGIALTGLAHTEETYQLISQQEIPSVAIWNYEPRSKIPCVGTDNFEAGAMAAQHLIDLGHRQIAAVFPPAEDNDRAAARWKGGKGALERAGVMPARDWIKTSQYSIAQAKEICLALFALRPLPSALVCGNDVIAQGALYAAQALGISVPDQISIVGIGDFPGSSEFEPALTTVRIPARRIGAQAGRQLISTIMETENRDVVRKRFDLEVMLRKTTATLN